MQTKMMTRALTLSAAVLTLSPACVRAHAAEGAAAEPAPSAPAQTAPKVEKTRVRFEATVRPEGEFFLPVSAHTRRLFPSVGEAQLGLRLAVTARRGDNGLRLFADGIHREEGDNEMDLGFLGLELRRNLLRSGCVRPYAAIGPVLATTRLRVQSEGLDVDPNMIGGSLMLGTEIGEHGLLEARYLAVPQVHGYNLSGVNLRAGIRF